MLRPDDLRLRYLAALAAVLPACGPSRDVPPPIRDGAPTTTGTATAEASGELTEVPRVRPTASALASTSEIQERPKSTRPPPASTPDVTRIDAGADWWAVSGDAVKAAHDPPNPNAKPSVPNFDRPQLSCTAGFLCVREPAKVVGRAGLGAYAKCDMQARPSDMVTDSVFFAFSTGVTALERKVEPTACCYRWNEMACGGGRPLRDENQEPIVALLVPRADWAQGCNLTPGLDEDVRAVLAAHWSREALAEHASIASFSVASLELLALGAPAHLVADVHRAALDEVEHARQCFALAARFGAPVGPGRLDVARHPIAHDVAAIARSTLHDACVNETVAALSAAAAADRARDLQARATLETLAADESRHAELGFRTLAWLRTTFGHEVTRVVRRELAALRTPLGSTPVPARDPRADALANHGVLDEAALARVKADAIARVVVPCLEALVAGDDDDVRDAAGVSRSA